MRDILFACFFFFALSAAAQEVQPALEILKPFDKVRDLAMNKNGDEAYFTIQSQNEEVSVIAKSIKKDSGWQEPIIVSFSGEYKDLEPFLAPDGLRLYFVSNRPLNPSATAVKDFDIWYVQRTNRDAEWSLPINMGAPVNTSHNEFYPALSKNGNLYFTCECPGAMGRDDIFFSAYEDGKYNTPMPLDANVNSDGFEYNAYISADDTFLIFGGYQRKDGLGSGDMYISFKDANGQWSKAKPLPAPANSKYMDYCPFVDEQNGVLYFTSRRSTDMEGGIESIEALSHFLKSYENGNSRLYKISLDVTTLQSNNSD